MQICGYMLDSARCLERRSYYRRMIEFAAARGVNTILWHFTDDQGCAMEFDSIPGLASPHAYSKREMRSLIRFARKRGVILIPELESLGHSRFITRLSKYKHLRESNTWMTSLCPVHPETRSIIRELLRETMEVFESPWVHAGLDEVDFGHHPNTRKALLQQSKTEIFTDYISFVHKVIGEGGCRMMMWGDHLLSDPEMVADIPRDVIICDWHYEPVVPEDSVQFFLEEGFDVLFCPALISDKQRLAPGRAALDNILSFARHRELADRGTVLGIVTTVWTPVRYMHDSLWAGLAAATDIMRGSGHFNLALSLREFTQDFYGFEASDEWTRACVEVFDRVPSRDDWHKVLIPKNLTEAVKAKYAATAAAWRACVHVMTVSRQKVRRNRRSYDTFVFFVRLMEFIYRRAADPSAISDTESARMLERVENTWNRERYPDDPKKYAADFDFEKTNHLLPMLGSVLK